MGRIYKGRYCPLYSTYVMSILNDKIQLVNQKRVELELSISKQIENFEKTYQVELFRNDKDSPKGVSFWVLDDINKSLS